jgi:cell volume regulation protein A
VEIPGDPATHIGAYMRERLGGYAEVGDRVPVGFLELIVRDTDEHGAVAAAGMALAPQLPPGPRAWPVLRAFVDLAAILRAWLDRIRPRRAGGDA